MPNCQSKPIGILAIQGDFAAHARVLESLAVPSCFVKRVEQLDGLAGLILPGGESTTLLKFLEQEGWWEPLRAFARSKPMLGTCAGAILLAKSVENPPQKSLAAIDVSVRRNAFGRQVFSFIRHANITRTFAKLLGPEEVPPDGKVEAVFIRAPLILETGKGVQELVNLDGSPVFVQQGNCLAATFHPELSTTGPGANLFHRYFSRLVYGTLPPVPTSTATSPS